MKTEIKNPEVNDQIGPLMTLKKALASYEETIKMVKSLSLDDDNRQTLAWAYLNRGEVLQALETVENQALEKALWSYEQAISLANQLPSNVAENRKILAKAYLKRGNVLRVSGTRQLETKEELAERRQRYSELAKLLRKQLENGDADYDERVGGLLEPELGRAL
jgi:tetratricopeptide (TPR) repeat protein